jgi:hypothetical protein
MTVEHVYHEGDLFLNHPPRSLRLSRQTDLPRRSFHPQAAHVEFRDSKTRIYTDNCRLTDPGLVGKSGVKLQGMHWKLVRRTIWFPKYIIIVLLLVFCIPIKF